MKDPVSAAAPRLAIETDNQKARLIRELRAERDQLAQALAEKEGLVKEIHHRVKNNLQVIASLLRLQANTIGHPLLAEALIECQQRVESMALIHEQLYGSANLSELPIDRHAKLLLSNLLHLYGDPAHIEGHAEITPLPDGSPLALPIEQAIPAGLILNELASNALKHGFPDRRPGSVRIEGYRQDGQIHLAVKDDGVGVPPDFDLRRLKSLGLQIVHILIRQLKGTWELERGTGTAFRLSFPEK